MLPSSPAAHVSERKSSQGFQREERVTRKAVMWGAVAAYTVISDSCSLVRFRGWLMTVMPYSSGFLSWGRLARKMALWATLRKLTMACQPLLLNHT